MMLYAAASKSESAHVNGIQITLSRFAVEKHVSSPSSDLIKLVSDFAGMLANIISMRF